jgi:hypothetical protein
VELEALIVLQLVMQVVEAEQEDLEKVIIQVLIQLLH